MIRIRRILIMAALLAALATMLAGCLIVPTSRPAARPSGGSSTAVVSRPQPKPEPKPAPQPSKPQAQSRKIIYARGRTHQVAGVVTVIRGGYQIRDEKSDTVFIFVNLSRADADRFQRMLGRRMVVRMTVNSGEETATIDAHFVGFVN